MDLYQQYIHMSRYSRWSDTLGRRETWGETVQRYVDFFDKRFEFKHTEVLQGKVKDAILKLEAMPSMRALMTAGEALERENLAAFNCSYMAVNTKRSMAEALYILMCGTGVGFSCERQEVAKLPAIPEQLHDADDVIVVGDSKLGWAKAYNRLLSALWDGDIPKLDYSKVRKAGERLKVFGGRASGPAPLKKLFTFTVELFKRAKGRKLNSLEVHDLMCMIGEIVVVGGVRRSALISLSNLSDQRMRDAKSGQWWTDNPQRALANNSVAYTEKPSAEIFLEEWLSLVKSKSGERGIFNRGASAKQAERWGRRPKGISWGTNPCCVVGETEILTDKGYFPIKALVSQEVSIWNGKEFSKVVPFSVGIHPTVTVALSDGTSLQCTKNHEFVLSGTRYTPEGSRVEARDLKVGDKLAKYAMPVIEDGEDYSVDAYSQGFFSGDGCTDAINSLLYEPKYACARRLVGKIGPQQKSVARKNWVHGPMLAKSFVPKNGSMKFCVEWLAGLLDSDGTVVSDINGDGLQIASNDVPFLNNVRLMLTRLGVQSKLNQMSESRLQIFKEGEKEYECKACFRLLINQADTYQLGLLGLRTERLSWRLLKAQRDARRFVKVVSVVANSTVENFCFDEPKNHTGTFNGIVTGQSEIILQDKQLCNLSEVVIRAEDTLETLMHKVEIATILGTMQSSLTKFGFVSETWTRNTIDEALLGVSLTGIMDNKLMSGAMGNDKLTSVLNTLRDHARSVNAEWAALLDVKPSAAITCVKPSGCTGLDTEIKTADGNAISMATLFEASGYASVESLAALPPQTWITPAFKTVVLDENNQEQEITKLFVNGMQPVYDIEFEDGKSYRFTGNHKLKTLSGWKRVDELTEQDTVVSY